MQRLEISSAVRHIYIYIYIFIYMSLGGKGLIDLLLDPFTYVYIFSPNATTRPLWTSWSPLPVVAEV
jgi:hypothetical protein